METAAISPAKASFDGGQLIQTYQPLESAPGQISLPKTADPQALLVFEQQMALPEIQKTTLNSPDIDRPGEVYELSSCPAGDIRTDNSCQLNDGRGGNTRAGILGDNILQSLDAIRNESNERFDSIQAMLDKDNLDSADLLQTQLDIQLWSLHHDVYSKVTGTFDRNVDTLLKAQ